MHVQSCCLQAHTIKCTAHRCSRVSITTILTVITDTSSLSNGPRVTRGPWETRRSLHSCCPRQSLAAWSTLGKSGGMRVQLLYRVWAHRITFISLYYYACVCVCVCVLCVVCCVLCVCVCVCVRVWSPVNKQVFHPLQVCQGYQVSQVVPIARKYEKENASLLFENHL